ncbi:ZIP zinc/iron transporter [Phlyctema vagabunda]|uniref:ZIP zinc/iron transporter n=1 Tax=Phlyctema vagabunda TaxID=108571 RepID=A0ABR4PJ89_9HELO
MSTWNITVECGGGNEYDGRIGIRISSIFVIGFGSLMGALLPVLAARNTRMHVPPVAFFIAKYFGSGVIIATAFIHLLAPAIENLASPCLTGPITSYSWAEGIALMTVFVMFFIELMAARFDVFGDHTHDLESSDPARDLMRQTKEARIQTGGDTLRRLLTTSTAKSSNASQDDTTISPVVEDPATVETEQSKLSMTRPRSGVPGREDDLSYPPGGQDHLAHQQHHGDDIDDGYFAAQMTAIFILEFGVIFHSIFIGLTLAVTGDEFNILYIVLVFHQTFEGLGLGSRLATAQWPKSKWWLPWALGTAYGFSTPIAIAIGLGVRTTFTPGSPRTMIVNGVFDAISAGILIYTGLVELMAHEFMFNQEMRRSSIRMMLGAFSCMVVGAGLMALLGKWA